MLGKRKQTTFHLYKWSIPVQRERHMVSIQTFLSFVPLLPMEP